MAHNLKERLDPDCVPSFMTDGLWGYFYALTAHFGEWFRPLRARVDHWRPKANFRHGQLVKRKERRKLKYAIQRMAWGNRSELFDVLDANDLGFETFKLTFEDGATLVDLVMVDGMSMTLPAGVDGLFHTVAGLDGALLSLKGEWDDDTFVLFYKNHMDGPIDMRFDITFEENAISIRVKENVSRSISRLTGNARN